jgi:molecular chaperone DnaJ
LGSLSGVQDLYAVLGVPRSATQEDIKGAYRRLARRLHPDRNQGSEEAESRFKAVASAYQTLHDPERRAAYDRKARQLGERGQSTTVFNEIFQEGRDFLRRARQAERGADLRITLEISLEESFRGLEKTVEIPTETRCARCGGIGAEPGTAPSLCPQCGGTGQRNTKDGSSELCAACEGRGKRAVHACRTCEGSGSTHGVKRIQIRIPEGVTEGTRLRLQGSGRPGRHGGAPGDLFADVSVVPHPFLERRQHDVWMEAPMSYPDAVLGANIDVPTLEGLVPLSYPAGTQPGTVLRLSGRGFWSDAKTRGNQFVALRLVVPNPEEAEYEHLAKSLADRAAGPDLRAVSEYRERLRELYGEVDN